MGDLATVPLGAADPPRPGLGDLAGGRRVLVAERPLPARERDVAAVADHVDEPRLRQRPLDLDHALDVGRRLLAVARLALRARRRSRRRRGAPARLEPLELLASARRTSSGSVWRSPHCADRGHRRRRLLGVAPPSIAVDQRRGRSGLGRDREIGMGVEHQPQHRRAGAADADDEREPVGAPRPCLPAKRASGRSSGAPSRPAAPAAWRSPRSVRSHERSLADPQRAGGELGAEAGSARREIASRSSSTSGVGAGIPERAVPSAWERHEEAVDAVGDELVHRRVVVGDRSAGRTRSPRRGGGRGPPSGPGARQTSASANIRRWSSVGRSSRTSSIRGSRSTAFSSFPIRRSTWALTISRSSGSCVPAKASRISLEWLALAEQARRVKKSGCRSAVAAPLLSSPWNASSGWMPQRVRRSRSPCRRSAPARLGQRVDEVIGARVGRDVLVGEPLPDEAADRSHAGLRSAAIASNS